MNKKTLKLDTTLLFFFVLQARLRKEDGFLGFLSRQRLWDEGLFGELEGSAWPPPEFGAARPLLGREDLLP